MLKRGLMNNKSGQLTIFIIIGIVIVAAGILIFLFWPKISSTFQGTSDPRSFIQNCIQSTLEKDVKMISESGGSFNPQPSILYNGINISYLCYTNEFYKQCVMQKPLLQSSIQKELEDSIREKVDSCFSELQKDYEDKGFNVLLTKKDISVELFPKRVRLTIPYKIVTTKEQSSEVNGFVVEAKNSIYDLTSVASSISNWEARYGDSETTLYMTYYPNLKVEKYKQGDGTTIYVVSDRDSKDKFVFATRSVAWPPGYGANK